MRKRISQFPWLFGISILLLTISGCASNPKPQITPKQPEERPPELVLKVYPTNSVAGIQGATVRITYRIERHPDNRAYRLAIGDEASEIYGHEKSLNGEHESAQFNPVFIDRLYEGSYRATLTLIRSEKGVEKKYVATQTFSVQ